MSCKPVDQRGKLEAQPFSYRASKDGQIFISWQGKTVTIVKGDAAERMLVKLKQADERTVQLILAKATGNFKHGNERH